MAFSPIAFTAANYRDYKDYWIKPYTPGTTTPKTMATDSTLSTFIAKAKINQDGFIETTSEVLIIPFIEAAYDLWMFPTEAEADANDTSNAIKLADDIIGVNGAILATSTVITFDTIEDAISNDDQLLIFDGAQLSIKKEELGNIGWSTADVVLASGVTVNEYDTFLSTEFPTLAIVLRKPVKQRTEWESLIKRISEGETIKIVCFGDSLTKGDGGPVVGGIDDYPTRLKELLDIAYRSNDCTLINAGIGGNTTQQLIDRFDSDVVSEDPDAVILMVGMNDLRPDQGVTVETYSENLEILYRLCFEQNYALLALDITPRWRTDNEGILQQSYYRQACRGIAEQYDVKFVPLYDIIMDLVTSGNGFNTGDLTYDGTHYRREGYYQIAGAVLCYGMNNGKYVYKTGDFIEPMGGQISPNINAVVTYDKTDAINESRLSFTITSIASSNLALMIWIEDYEQCDLTALISRGVVLSDLPILSIRNTSYESTSSLQFTVGYVGVETGKTIFGAPLTCEVLRPGMNVINMTTDNINTTLNFDGFYISKRSDGNDQYFKERFNPAVRETYYELSQADADFKIEAMEVIVKESLDSFIASVLS